MKCLHRRKNCGKNDSVLFFFSPKMPFIYWTTHVISRFYIIKSFCSYYSLYYIFFLTILFTHFYFFVIFFFHIFQEKFFFFIPQIYFWQFLLYSPQGNCVDVLSSENISKWKWTCIQIFFTRVLSCKQCEKKIYLSLLHIKYSIYLYQCESNSFYF